MTSLGLDLSFNLIESIQADTFDGLLKLEILRLTDNKIKEIDVKFLTSVPKLEHIHIRDNICIDLSFDIAPFEEFKTSVTNQCLPSVRLI